MISIFVMYSPDRLPQLKTMMRCLEEMEGYKNCQKILIADETANIRPDNWDVVEVPRPKGQFNWSSMWDAGVSSSVYDKILYLDSDRILPRDYLVRVADTLGDNKVLFCGSMFCYKDYHDQEVILDHQANLTLDVIRDEWRIYKGLFNLDPRWRLPLHGPGKGPCSGNTAFTKNTFLDSGGVDPWFEGHGAYADTDFHKQLWERGVEFIDMDCFELHLRHPKLGEESEELTMRDIEVLSLNNFIYHCKKWDLGYKFPRVIATWLNLPPDFVDRVLDRIDCGGHYMPYWA